MKKKIFLLLVIGLMLTGCLKKDKISQDEFKSTLEKEGFEIQETENGLLTNQTKSILVGTNSSKSCFINYVEYYEINDAKNYFNSASDISSCSVKTSTSGTNYDKYTCDKDGKFVEIVRVENVVITGSINSKDKKYVKETMKKLGY